MLYIQVVKWLNNGQGQKSTESCATINFRKECGLLQTIKYSMWNLK